MRFNNTRPDPNPSGLCMCGCGQLTAFKNRRHSKFIHGHNAKPMSKRCRNCGQRLPASAFDPQLGRDGQIHGLKKSCRECVASWQSKIRLAAIEGVPERFWSKVDQSAGPDACWPWLGQRSPSGYGVITIRTPKGRDQMRANRLALILSGVEIPDGMLACHHCDNPPCCNPAHLFVGTPADNTHDGMNKGRINRALTPADVVEIRAMYATGGWSYQRIADRFGCGIGTVRDVIKFITWKDVT